MLFVLLVLVLDRGFGVTLKYLYKRTRSGEAGGLINAALASKAQVLLLGSSRMMHHVDPKVLSKSLSLTVYNAGLNGEDFLYAAMLMDLWQRYNPPPRAIVLHVDESSFTRSEDELKRASIFSFYWSDSNLVREVIDQRSALEPLKYLSFSFRANGKVLPVLRNLLAPGHQPSNGFIPLSGTMRVEPQGRTPDTSSLRLHPLVFWDFKVNCFNSLAAYCRRNGTRLFLFHSPRFTDLREDHDSWVGQLRRLLADHPEVEFIDICEFACPQSFTNRQELFVDDAHLNAKGAEIVSGQLAAELQARLRASSVHVN